MTHKDKGDGIAYARKEPYEWENKQYEADIQDGDTVKILDEGRVEEGQYGPQKKFLIETRNGEKRVNLNQGSENVLIAAFGDESASWVGEEVNVLTRKAVIGGKRVVVAYLVVEGWYLDDYGDLVKDGDEVKKKIDYPDEPEINPDDIPF